MVDSAKQCFVTLPDEELLVCEREHWISVLPPLLVTAGITFLLLIGASILHIIGVINIPLFVSTSLVCITSALCVGTKIIVDWYYRIYVITSRKILEVNYAPFSHQVNNVFLDQVRITEIDVQTGGFWQQLIDVGTVVIYFDRPSHDKTFVLRAIARPRQVGVRLSDALERIMHNQPIWFKPRHKSSEQDMYKFAEDIDPKQSFAKS